MDHLENWKEIAGYEGYYEVSDLGRVRSVERQNKGPWGSKRTIKGRILKTHINTSGYHQLSLCKEHVTVKRYVHTLVLETFVGPCPEGMDECLHIDENKLNNSTGNLRWGTHLENVRASKKHRARLAGSKAPVL